MSTSTRRRSASTDAGEPECVPRAFVAAACAALALLVALSFQPVLRAGFVDWDDPANFVDNLRWRGLSREHLAWMATTTHMGHWQPLAWLTLGIDHALFGLDPRAMHATNVAWHAATALVFLGLARELVARAAPTWSARRVLAASACAAALFAVHPLRCESVCWITERRDVVSGFFFVAATLAWTRYASHDVGRGGRAHHVLALAAQCLSLLAKAWGIVIPVLFLVVDVVYRRRERGTPWSRLLVEKIPFACASAAVGWINLRAHAGATDAQATWSEHGLATRVVQAAYGALFYAWKTILPFDLSPHVELPPSHELLRAPYAAALAGAVAITGLALALRRRRPWLAWSWIAYLVVFAPVSGLAQAGPQLVADRYSYLACLPFAVLGGAALAHPRVPRAVSVAAIATVVAALVVATRAQSRVWIDSASLWERALAHDPASAVANAHAAGVRLRAADATDDVSTKRALVDRAAEHYARAYERSRNPSHVVNAGGVLRLRAELEPERRGELIERALAAVEAGIAAARTSGTADPRWSRTRAALLLDLARTEEARGELSALVAAMPDDVVARVLLARSLEALDRPAEALAHREHAARLRPDEPESWIALGETLVLVGRDADARIALERGLDLATRTGATSLVERARDGLARTR